MNDYKYIVTAAGRMNIIGEHVDYCGGKVLPAALSLKNTVYIRPNDTNKINISWSTLTGAVSLDVGALEQYKDLEYGKYQAGCAFMWQRAGHKVVGCDMYMDCTVPFGSGLSSSAAIEVSTIAALATVAGETFDPVEVAFTAQQAENGYVGMNCGIMDQYASACGKEGYAMLLDCKTLKNRYVPLRLGDYSIVIIDCKKPHNLVESKYNERRGETEEALRILQRYADIDCLADLTPQKFSEICRALEGDVLKRATHVVNECARVRRAVAAMEAGDIPALGNLLNLSHKSLSKLYEVTGAELDALANIAQSHPDCIGSRMTGAGFGGCTISLVKAGAEEDFKRHVLAEYEKRTGYRAECYSAHISDGITVKKLS